MRRLSCLMLSALTLALVLPLSVGAVTETKTGVEYPDMVTTGCNGQQVELQATGTGLREKTFMKVDVYTIVSYVEKGSDLGADKAAGVMALKAPKQIQLNLRRSFSREKLIKALTEVIDKNYPDQAAFAGDLELFKGYFTRDAQDGDVIVFDYCPSSGLTVMLNGEISGIIEKFPFTEALWSVWFGPACANEDLKAAMLSAVK